MKIAAIDLGSNSIHLVIVEVRPSGGFHVVASEKEMVRLGQTTLSRARPSATAMARGLDVLREYRRLCRSHRVDKVLAVATSAIDPAVGSGVLAPHGLDGRSSLKAVARLVYAAGRARPLPDIGDRLIQ